MKPSELIRVAADDCRSALAWWPKVLTQSESNLNFPFAARLEETVISDGSRKWVIRFDEC